jgi:hypothetical protein
MSREWDWFVPALAAQSVLSTEVAKSDAEASIVLNRTDAKNQGLPNQIDVAIAQGAAGAALAGMPATATVALDATATEGLQSSPWTQTAPANTTPIPSLAEGQPDAKRSAQNPSPALLPTYSPNSAAETYSPRSATKRASPVAVTVGGTPSPFVFPLAAPALTILAPADVRPTSKILERPRPVTAPVPPTLANDSDHSTSGIAIDTLQTLASPGSGTTSVHRHSCETEQSR